MIANTPFGRYKEHDHPPWPWIVGLSMMLHGFIFLGFWGLEAYAPRRFDTPSAISVSLVSGLPENRSIQQSSPIEEKKDQPKIKKRIRKPAPLARRKLVSINPPELKPPERKKMIPESRPDPKPTPSPSTARRESTPAVTAAPAEVGEGGHLGLEEARYLELLRERIIESWRAYLPPEEGVLGEVRIQISSDGRIHEFDFVRGSGKAHVDASIVRALKKVALPPPPSSLAERPLLLRFWPFGQRA